MPAARARSTAASSSRDLPMPASPSTTTAAPVPAPPCRRPNAAPSARRAARPGPLPIPLDLHSGRPAEADDRAERVRLVVHEPQAGQRRRELLQHDAGLQPRQRGAEAVVRAVAEREVLGGLAPPDVEALGIGEHLGI